MEKIDCPHCKGLKKYKILVGKLKDQIVSCWYCRGSGEVNGMDELSGLLFESMIQDSINLRQKCLWKYTQSDLEDAIKLQINSFKEAIVNCSMEEEYLIEEYRGHLERFTEWSEYFLMDAKAIYKLKDEDVWIKKWL